MRVGVSRTYLTGLPLQTNGFYCAIVPLSFPTTFQSGAIHLETTLEAVMKPVRVLIVDDHISVRESLAILLEPKGILVCGDAGTCAEALAGAEKRHPDMALVDISLGDEEGITLITELAKRALPSLAYSIHEDERHVRKALAAGARGYVTKREAHRVLVHAIIEVAAGRCFVSPRAVMNLTEHDLNCMQHGKYQPDGHECLDNERGKSSGNNHT